MKRIDYIKKMNAEELAEFILEFDMEEISSVMCNLYCPHRSKDENGKLCCSNNESDDCLYSDEDMVHDWLLLRVEKTISEVE